MSKYNSLLAGNGLKKAVAGIFAAATLITFSAASVRADSAPLPVRGPASHTVLGEEDGAVYLVSSDRAIWGEEEINDFFDSSDRAIWGEGVSFLSRAIWGEEDMSLFPVADPVFGYPISLSQVLWSDEVPWTDPDPDPTPDPEPEPDPDPTPDPEP